MANLALSLSSSSSSSASSSSSSFSEVSQLSSASPSPPPSATVPTVSRQTTKAAAGGLKPVDRTCRKGLNPTLRRALGHLAAAAAVPPVQPALGLSGLSAATAGSTGNKIGSFSNIGSASAQSTANAPVATATMRAFAAAKNGLAASSGPPQSKASVGSAPPSTATATPSDSSSTVFFGADSTAASAPVSPTPQPQHLQSSLASAVLVVPPAPRPATDSPSSLSSAAAVNVRDRPLMSAASALEAAAAAVAAAVAASVSSDRAKSAPQAASQAGADATTSTASSTAPGPQLSRQPSAPKLLVLRRPLLPATKKGLQRKSNTRATTTVRAPPSAAGAADVDPAADAVAASSTGSATCSTPTTEGSASAHPCPENTKPAQSSVGGLQAPADHAAANPTPLPAKEKSAPKLTPSKQKKPKTKKATQPPSASPSTAPMPATAVADPSLWTYTGASGQLTAEVKAQVSTGKRKASAPKQRRKSLSTLEAAAAAPKLKTARPPAKRRKVTNVPFGSLSHATMSALGNSSSLDAFHIADDDAHYLGLPSSSGQTPSVTAAELEALLRPVALPPTFYPSPTAANYLNSPPPAVAVSRLPQAIVLPGSHLSNDGGAYLCPSPLVASSSATFAATSAAASGIATTATSASAISLPSPQFSGTQSHLHHLPTSLTSPLRLDHSEHLDLNDAVLLMMEPTAAKRNATMDQLWADMSQTLLGEDAADFFPADPSLVF